MHVQKTYSRIAADDCEQAHAADLHKDACSRLTVELQQTITSRCMQQTYCRIAADNCKQVHAEDLQQTIASTLIQQTYSRLT